MTTYTLISNDKILRRVKCSADNLPHQLAAGETAIEGIFTQKSHKVVGGVLVELSPAEIDALPPRHALIEKTNRQLILHLIEQLEMSGFTIPLNVDVIKTKLDALKAIDLAAGRARFRIASSGVFVDQEYLLAEQAVKQWRLEGNPTENVPDELQSWVDASGFTLEDAAQDIEYNAIGFKYMFAMIRRARLTGKAAIQAANAGFSVIAQTYIDQLDAL